jgi:hypothetical protein
VVQTADPAKVRPTAHVWEPICGPGCERAELLSGPYAFASWTFGSKLQDGDLLLSIPGLLWDSKGFRMYLAWVFALESDALIGLAASKDCILGGNAATGRAFVVVPHPENLPATLAMGPARPEDGFVFDLYDNPTYAGELFDFASGWGLLHGTGPVEVSDSLYSSHVTTIDYGRDNTRVTSLGEAGFWSVWPSAGYATLHSWTRTDGLVTLLQGPWHVNSAAVSPSRLVWLATQRDAVDRPLRSAQLNSSPFATRPSEVVEHAGPVLPATVYGFRVKTGGDWAAVEDIVNDRFHILLVDLRDGRVFRIRPRAGFQLGLIAMTATRLVAWESPDQVDASKRYTALLRYDISETAASLTPEPAVQ